MPPDFLYLERRISQIGNKLVSCQRDCAGISRDQAKGILPRCLILEAENRNTSSGLAIIGINPAHSNCHERMSYKDGHDYQQVVDYWKNHVAHQWKYYEPLREFEGLLGFGGPILWSELVKCESVPDLKVLPPEQTFRTCIKKYLAKELRGVPSDWPILAVGKKAYHRLPCYFPERTVIGVPHPARGHLKRFIKSKRYWLPKVQEYLSDKDGSKGKKPIWLRDLS